MTRSVVPYSSIEDYCECFYKFELFIMITTQFDYEFSLDSVTTFLNLLLYSVKLTPYPSL